MVREIHAILTTAHGTQTMPVRMNDVSRAAAHVACRMLRAWQCNPRRRPPANQGEAGGRCPCPYVRVKASASVVGGQTSLLRMSGPETLWMTTRKGAVHLLGTKPESIRSSLPESLLVSMPQPLPPASQQSAADRQVPNLAQHRSTPSCPSRLRAGRCTRTAARCADV